MKVTVVYEGCVISQHFMYYLLCCVYYWMAIPRLCAWGFW